MAEIPQNSFQGPLAPKYGLNDNFRNPIPGGGNLPKKEKRKFTGLIPVGAIALALLILPLTLQQLNQQQDTRQRASGPAPTVVFPTSVIKLSPTSTAVISPTENASGSGIIR